MKHSDHLLNIDHKMLSFASPVKIALALVTTCYLLHTIGAQNCPMLTLSDLGSNQTFSSMGLVSTLLLDNQVQIIDFNIVCLSSGVLRDTYSTASVVISYMCEGGVCAERVPGVLTDQFVFLCNGDVWGNSVNLIMNPSASLSTPLDTSCSECTADPEISDPVTLCISKLLHNP